mgnify:CR=1 FL=1
MSVNYFEYDYRKLLTNIITHGQTLTNRTGINTKAIFNYVIDIDVNNGFPIITGKKIFFDKAYWEYKWIQLGKTNIDFLNKHNIKWWNKYANSKGELDKTYGYQLRNFNGKIDQLKFVIKELKNNSRRAHITLWNPSDLDAVVLPCCYTGFTFVRIKDQLNMSMQFRSSDVFLGLPYDVIVGSLFLYEIAEQTNLKPNKLSLVLANAHIYENHNTAVEEYLSRPIYNLPNYIYPNILKNYTSDELIKAELNGV